MFGIKRKLLGVLTAVAMAAAIIPSLPSEKLEAEAVDVNSYTAKQIAQNMGLGWNLGNSLDALPDAASGNVGLRTEVAWGNPMTTENTFRTIKARGFTTVRIPVTWWSHVTSGDNIDPNWFNRVHTVVDWALGQGLFVILNIHHEESNWLVPTEAKYSEVSSRLKNFWRQIATEFASYDKHLIFEGMNEPREVGGGNEWNGGTSSMRGVINKLNSDFVSTVRATGGLNATRALMVPTYAASNTWAAMNELRLPSDPNLIVSVHAYTPYEFCMTPYKTFDGRMQNQLTDFFRNLDTLFVNKGIPVCIGEFGSSNYNNESERVKWANAFAQKAKSRNIPICVWDNNIITGSNNNTDNYGLLNRNNMTWYAASDDVTAALINTFGGSSSEPPAPAYVPTFAITGTNGTAYTSNFKQGDTKITINLSGATYFKDLGGVVCNAAAPGVYVSAIVVNDSYLVPVKISLKGNVSGSNLIAPITGAGKVSGAVYQVRSGSDTFGFYGNGGASVAFRVNGFDTAVTKLDYICTDKITPKLLGAQEYDQFSKTMTNGKYAQRHVIMIKKGLAAHAQNIAMTYYAGSFSGTVTTDKFYTSLTADGRRNNAPAGYVLIVTWMNNISNVSYPLMSGTAYKALATNCVLNF